MLKVRLRDAFLDIQAEDIELIRLQSGVYLRGYSRKYLIFSLKKHK